MDTKHAIVIGSGIGGIATALRLASMDYRVTVFEQAARPGGKISQWQHQGFRFDTGPSLLTLPHLIDELFELFGENPAEHFPYKPLRISCKYFWEDGTIINAWNNPEQFATEIETTFNVPATRVLAFLARSKELYDTISQAFLFNSLHKPANYLKPAFLKAMACFYKLDALTTMHRKNSLWFDHPKLIQLFDRYATYNGSSPYQTPATFNVIPHLEHNMGAFFPAKGMYSIITSLTELARRQGVQFAFGSAVEEIIFDNNTSKGVRVNGQISPASLIVSNIDVINFYRKLMPGQKIPQNQITSQRSSSAMIFCWGIKGVFPQLEVHNILFSDNYRQEFEYLFTKKSISSDPTVYIFISSKIVPQDAPAGSENWYVMVNAPENTGQDWKDMRLHVKQIIVEKIKKTLQIDINQLILFEKVIDPSDIESTTGSYRGSLYGPGSHSPMSAFMRHANFRKKYRGLYFTGGSVHPGGGIPLCLASARIVGQEIRETHH